MGGFLTSKVLSYVSGGLAIAFALLALHDWRVDNLRAKYKGELTAIVAKGKAMAKQAERLTKASRDLADETDRKTVVTVTRFRDRVMRLPSANSVCAAVKDHGAESPAGPSYDAVLLEREDALICATNQGRLEEAHDWAVRLQALQDSPGSAIP